MDQLKNNLLIALGMLLLGGVLGFFIGHPSMSQSPRIIMTPTLTPVAITSERPTTTLPATNPTFVPTPTTPPGEKIKVILATLPITFELPRGYAAFQGEGFEGAYGTSVSIGREVREGYFRDAPLGISISPGAYDETSERNYKPSEYIDVVFANRKDFESPQYIKIFGNKAVRHTIDSGGMAIVGYIRADQLSENQYADEYLVTIDASNYGTGMGDDQVLFDTVVSTLRISK